MSEDVREQRLFIEEICCNLLRFYHAQNDHVSPERISINQEVSLGIPGAFADIRVKPPEAPPYFVEVKYGYPSEMVVAHMRRKYGCESAVTRDASRLVLVLDARSPDELAAIETELSRDVHHGLALEIWNEAKLLSLVREQLSLQIDSFTSKDILDIRAAVDRAKGLYAFGDAFRNEPLQTALLWHFGFWKLKQLREARGMSARDILPPGLYRAAVVLFADLSSFSSFVRDTRDDAVIRHVLTSFYSKARNEVLNCGGMMYQFLGDGLIGLFGIPDGRQGFEQNALECARRLIDIGNSVSLEWQRSIDHVESSGGAHIGMALGDINVMSLRPFGRAHMGIIAESVNLAARLTSAAEAGDIVVSNTLYRALPETSQAALTEMEPVEARNIGRIRAWRLGGTRSD
ncbi:MAG: adenylate/guanylate cyclase domain-containing protein [Spirochaetia bacterium]|jgi:class 3 adenylate cyclase